MVRESARLKNKAATEAASAATTPQVLLVNPTLRENWSNPSTPAEFNAWMVETKAALLKWLNEAAAQARDPDIRDKIDEYEKEAWERWQAFEEETDVETGEIHDPIRREEMEEAVIAERVNCSELHKRHETWRKFVEYRHALQAWEDFLYYQNVWNRRYYVPGKIYSEVPTGNKGPASLETPNERVGGEGKEPGAKAPKKTKGKAKAKDAPVGTPDQESTNRTDIEYHNQPFQGIYNGWMWNMIALYEQARLGYRKRIPAVVAPQDAHRYSQPPRGTIPQTTPSYQHRYRHLEERFPRRKRKQIDINEVEERCRRKAERKLDIRLERARRMEPITWSIDEKAYEKLRAEKETEYSKNPLTINLLPEGHKTHHGSLETSFNWPTSFDAPVSTILKTTKTRDHVYEPLSDPEHDPSDPKSRKRFLGYKKDGNGARIKKIDNRPHYQRETTMQEGLVFEHQMRADGTVKGRDRTGEWIGDWVPGQIASPVWVYDEDGNRIPLPPRYESRNRFSTFLVKESHIRETRRQRHEDAEREYELSDDEDEGCVHSNANFSRSGNGNPEQLGNPWASNIDSDGEGGEGGEGEGVGHPGDSDDDDSDDDGDLFAESYRECSESPATRQARFLLEDLRERFGVLESWTVESVRNLQRPGNDGSLVVGDEEIIDWYKSDAEGS
ncbi:uncharacterized protein J4E84_006901 [Alternaria hordeiaustralica]|uniref:uncharacterized protein n=1 Tax=Alternaria hordeiaustralica TaxID=1187925 RepID=UPI0020C580A5|nr:uncharacterized protein J4E84_006901 [Alternaria hordeiaustralica]KAI4682999.1 hypothetical protein J4E84_006901 [Alternaria hordeiaustralica]